jgi:hypothetical protein
MDTVSQLQNSEILLLCACSECLELLRFVLLLCFLLGLAHLALGLERALLQLFLPCLLHIHLLALDAMLLHASATCSGT